MWAEHPTPEEGEVYKKLTVGGHTFELRYGYYDERERNVCPPVVIWPDLSDGSKRCPEGCHLVTQVQDPCEHYTPTDGREDNWCGDCTYYTGEHREIGICRCEARKHENHSGGNTHEKEFV